MPHVLHDLRVIGLAHPHFLQFTERVSLTGFIVLNTILRPQTFNGFGVYARLMGIDEVLQEGSLADQDELTVGQLKQMYGEEVVRRALQYMNSLVEADEQFRQSADPKQMEEGYKQIEGVGDELPEAAKKGSEKWAEAMQDSGLGISDE